MVCLLIVFFGVMHSAWASPPSPIRDVRVVLFVVDGCRADRFVEALRRGDLPTVQREFVERGAQFRRALAVFPSATPTGYQAMVSGLFPGHAGIPYLEWFDRERGKYVPFLTPSGRKRIDASFRNLYAPAQSRSLFDDLAGHPTAAVFAIFSRGAAVRQPTNPLPAAWPLFVTHRLEKLDRLAFRHLTNLFWQSPVRIPRFTLVGLLSTDALQHKYGVETVRVRDNLRAFDTALRQFLDLLAQRGLSENTYVIITADHGMHDIDGLFDLPRYLRDHGLRPFRKRNSRRGYDVYVGIRGLGTAMLALPGRGGWGTDPTIADLRAFPRRDGTTVDLLRLLMQAPEVALLVVREDPRHVRLYREGAEAVIAINATHTHYAYTVVPGMQDPLGLRDDPRLRHLTTGVPRTPEQWVRLTAETAYPDAVVQLGQIFADGRAGHLVVISTPAWGFFREKAATHGGHTADDMRVPLLIRGPTIPHGTFDLARLVDLYPTMLHWFGLGRPVAPVDGRPLFR